MRWAGEIKSHLLEYTSHLDPSSEKYNSTAVQNFIEFNRAMQYELCTYENGYVYIYPLYWMCNTQNGCVHLPFLLNV